MFLTILAIAIFAVTMALAMSFLYFFVEAPLGRRKMMTRLTAIQQIAVREDVPDILRKELLSDVPILNRILATTPGIPQLRLFMEQAAVRMQVGTFLSLVIAVPVLVFLVTLV